MDFIVLYSKYSERCEALFTEIPLLAEKAFCIDSKAGRIAVKKLPCKIYGVPTLIITDGLKKILKVIEGYDGIKSWFLLTTYSLTPASFRSGSAGVEQPVYEEQQPLLPPDDLMPNEENFTSLDDLFIESGPSNKADKVNGVKAMAEQLQRERDSFLEEAGPSKKIVQ